VAANASTQLAFAVQAVVLFNVFKVTFVIHGAGPILDVVQYCPLTSIELDKIAVNSKKTLVKNCIKLFIYYNLT
jgi:hypothetical protein